MFNSITGTLTAKNPGKINYVFIENSGIEWEIAVPRITLDEFPSIGNRVTVYTWLYHKEDAMRLFGFFSAESRSVFLDLITVEGVGPVGALKIMSNVSADQLAEALDAENMSVLEKAAGKKTAQKMMLKLKGKVTRISSDTADHTGDDGEFADIVTALADMGFDRKAARAAVDRAAEKLRSADSSVDRTTLEKNVFHDAIVQLS